MKFVYLQEREKYKLGKPESFHYLNQSKCYKLDGVSDCEEYLALRRAMDIVGINNEEQVALSIKAIVNLFSILSFYMNFLQFNGLPGSNISGCCCSSSSW